ncbi:MAG: prepilin-type N-terminal cleavage/methylation domain-containing protein, partial [Verrucomicrobiota bacterium]
MERKPSQLSRQRRELGFTLAEILVVVTLSLILIGIAFPTYHYILQRAHGTDCQAHLRQMGTALNGYLADHDLQMPVMRAARADKGEESSETVPPTLDELLLDYIDHVDVFNQFRRDPVSILLQQFDPIVPGRAIHHPVF